MINYLRGIFKKLTRKIYKFKIRNLYIKICLFLIENYSFFVLPWLIKLNQYNFIVINLW